MGLGNATSNGTTIYRVGPTGLTPSAGLIVLDIVPVSFKAIVTAGNANPATYSLAAQLTP